MTLQTTTGIELFGDDLRIVVLAGLTRGIRVSKNVVIEGFGAIDPASRTERLASAVRTHRIATRNVHLVLPGSFGTVRELDVPVSGELAEAVALQLESVSPWPIEEIWWSAGRPAGGGDPSKSKTGIRKVMVSIIPADVARGWVESFQRAGLPLASLSLAPAAWADGLVRLLGSDRPSLALGVVDQGLEGVLVTRDRTTVAGGGSGSEEVRRTLAGLVGRARVQDPDTIRLVARGPIPEELEPQSLATLPVSDGAHAGIDNFGAVAAALAAGGGPNGNLIPPSLREKRDVLRFVPTVVVAACLLLAVTALFIREPYQYLRYSQRMDAEVAELAPLVDTVIAEDTELAAAREQFALLDALIVDDSNLEALVWLAESMPLDTWVTSYSSQGSVLTLSGYSAATSRFQLLLEESPLFEGVELASPVTRDAANRERFTLRMRLAGVS